MTRSEFDPVRALLRALPLILAVALVGGLVLGALYAARDQEFTSQTKVQFDVGASPAAIARQSSGLSGPDAERALNTQRDVVTSDAVLQRVRTAVELSPTVVRRSTTVELDEGSNVLTITATASTPTAARELAAGLADAYAAQSKESGSAQLRGQADALDPAIAQLGEDLARAGGDSAAASAIRGSIQSQLVAVAQQQQQLRAAAVAYEGQVSVLAAAGLPEGPSTPGRLRGTAEGAVLGALLGGLIALLLELRRARRGGADSAPERELPQERPRTVAVG